MRIQSESQNETDYKIVSHSDQIAIEKSVVKNEREGEK